MPYILRVMGQAFPLVGLLVVRSQRRAGPTTNQAQGQHPQYMDPAIQRTGPQLKDRSRPRRTCIKEVETVVSQCGGKLAQQNVTLSDFHAYGDCVLHEPTHQSIMKNFKIGAFALLISIGLSSCSMSYQYCDAYNGVEFESPQAGEVECADSH